MMHVIPTTIRYSAVMHPQQQPSVGFFMSPKLPAKPFRTFQGIAKPITPTSNDVLMGRGGKNNMHCGNEQLRCMARGEASGYMQADKKEKASVALKLANQVRALSPPGRFLRRDPVSMMWYVVSDELAKEKCSQCLRDAVQHIKSKQQEAPAKNKRSLQTTDAPDIVRRVSDPEVNVTGRNKRRRTQTNNDASVITGNFFDISGQNELLNIFDNEFNCINFEESVEEEDLLWEQFREMGEIGVP